MSSSELEPTQWKILADRLVDENPFIRLSIASVELPDGTKFEQYVMRMRRTATTVVLDEQDRVLLMWRHRFITDQWVWELPGGYVDQAEDPAAAAAREVEEETGWRPLKKPEFVMTFQPMIGNADSPQDLNFVKGAIEVGCPDANETRRVAWVPLNDAVRMIKEGEIAGAGSVIGILLCARYAARPRLAGRGSLAGSSSCARDWNSLTTGSLLNLVMRRRRSRMYLTVRAD